MKLSLFLLSCFLISAARGSGWCNANSYSINSPLLFSCDDSQLRNEISALNGKIDELIAEVSQIRDALIPTGPLGSQSNPAPNCSAIMSGETGRYWLLGAQNEPVQVTCDFDVQLPPLSPVSGWQEIANVDLSDSSQSCPSPWGETLVDSIRRCERSDGQPGCEPALFPTGGVPFTKVCGRVVGYGAGGLDGFNIGCSPDRCDINTVYVDGVSITYNGPSDTRQHIWSFGVGRNAVPVVCPCSLPSTIVTPNFVGEDYYCDHTFDTSTTLWDGEGCGQGQCCANPNLPWFCREFDEPITTDNIEVRLCSDEHGGGEDVEVGLVKIFLQ